MHACLNVWLWSICVIMNSLVGAPFLSVCVCLCHECVGLDFFSFLLLLFSLHAQFIPHFGQ